VKRTHSRAGLTPHLQRTARGVDETLVPRWVPWLFAVRSLALAPGIARVFASAPPLHRAMHWRLAWGGRLFYAPPDGLPHVHVAGQRGTEQGQATCHLVRAQRQRRNQAGLEQLRARGTAKARHPSAPVAGARRRRGVM
jgi:hypothetical protein